MAKLYNVFVTLFHVAELPTSTQTHSNKYTLPEHRMEPRHQDSLTQNNKNQVIIVLCRYI